MTQDGQFDSQFGGRFDDRSTAEANPFAAAEQVSATLGTLTDALFDGRTSRHPVASLDPRRGSPAPHPAAEALFGLPLAPNGPVHAAVDRLGTVVTAGTARPGTGAPVAERTVTALLARYGGGPVRGTTVDRATGSGTTPAALFQLPVTGEIADPKLRPPFAPALAALAGGQQTRLPVELATGAGTEVRLVVPPGFHSLTSPDGPAGVSSRSVPPPGGTLDRGDDRAVVAAVDGLTGHLAEVAEELFSATDGGPRRDFAVITAALADVVHAAGAVYAGVCALEADGRTTEATLVVSLARHPLPITALATELATVRRHAEVWTVLLPAGPAAVLVEGRTVPVPAALASDGQRRWVVTSVVEAFVPLPDGVSVLCVQLSTAQPEDWDLYTEAFAELLKSVQFGWDGTPGVPAPVPGSVPGSVPAEPETAAPLDHNPFAALVEAADAPATEEEPALPDFNPFAAIAEEPSEDEPEQGDPALRGTPVQVPPPDFNPFAPETLPPLPGDAPAEAAPAAPAVAADPFGTVVADEPSDPFGTTLAPQRPPVPPPPSVPPRIPARTDGPGYAAADENDGEGHKNGEDGEDDEPSGDPALRGTPVRVPPPDFNPFAPETLPPLPGDAPADTASDTPATPPVPEARPFG
ncbi:hypothetical protein PUR71_30955 [Streptomyces sp. SP17BM10]|uniref:hypothetical protein n=1 Tax=Streptomyces sp. SP17BM10 TaxID=3002530 RepID=UPI002E75A7DF|nr:hypothetical protein [Streptomyces sp. SP17BM10]MEE1787289.1 hypothetical protein [Streptomyces sp. SP17BM10]